MSTIGHIVNVEAVIVHNNRYLMIIRGEQEQHAPGTLSVPGGKVEHCGNMAHILEETLRREVQEEVGIEIDDTVEYLESKTFVTGDGVEVLDIVFLCRYKQGTPSIIDTAEVSELRWMSLEEILAHPKTPPWTRQSILIAEQKQHQLLKRYF